MVSLISVSKAQQSIASNVRQRRLAMNFTQEDLSERSGVPLATLRKFEQKGIISVEALLKLLLIVGGIDELLQALKPPKPTFVSIDDVLSQSTRVTRKRGRKK